MSKLYPKKNKEGKDIKEEKSKSTPTTPISSKKQNVHSVKHDTSTQLMGLLSSFIECSFEDRIIRKSLLGVNSSGGMIGSVLRFVELPSRYKSKSAADETSAGDVASNVEMNDCENYLSSLNLLVGCIYKSLDNNNSNSYTTTNANSSSNNNNNTNWANCLPYDFLEKVLKIAEFAEGGISGGDDDESRQKVSEVMGIMLMISSSMILFRCFVVLCRWCGCVSGVFQLF